MLKNKKNPSLTPLINVLTRTSHRPVGFFNCYQSVLNQTYKKVTHWVSYEDEITEQYINLKGVNKVKVERYEGEPLLHDKGYLHAPYNLYCNTLLDCVDSGWIMFLDDDDHLLHNKVLQEVAVELKSIDEDTLFIWQMRYPDGKLLPQKRHFEQKTVERNKVSTPCFMFHSKYKKHMIWDEWKGSDFRVLNELFKIIPNKKWIETVYVQVNNFGDYGNRNDIKLSSKSKLLYYKSFYWFLIPKYHTRLKGVFVFHNKTYRQLTKKMINKVKKYVKYYR